MQRRRKLASIGSPDTGEEVSWTSGTGGSVLVAGRRNLPLVLVLASRH